MGARHSILLGGGDRWDPVQFRIEQPLFVCARSLGTLSPQWTERMPSVVTQPRTPLAVSPDGDRSGMGKVEGSLRNAKDQDWVVVRDCGAAATEQEQST